MSPQNILLLLTIAEQALTTVAAVRAALAKASAEGRDVTDEEVAQVMSGMREHADALVREFGR